MKNIELVFATNNPHKLREASQILGPNIEILMLNEIGCFDEIPEDAATVEANA